MKEYYTDSHGVMIENPKFLREGLRILSFSVKGKRFLNVHNAVFPEKSKVQKIGAKLDRF